MPSIYQKGRVVRPNKDTIRWDVLRRQHFNLGHPTGTNWNRRKFLFLGVGVLASGVLANAQQRTFRLNRLKRPDTFSAPEDPPPSPPTWGGGPNTLDPANHMHYLGSAGFPLFPSFGVDFAGSTGCIAARFNESNGTVDIFIGQTNGQVSGHHDALCILRYNNPNSVTLLGNYGGLGSDKKLHSSGAIVMGGLYYDEISGRLCETYGDTYDTGFTQDPHLVQYTFQGTGYTEADATSFGPWRTEQDPHKVKGYIHGMPAECIALNGRWIGNGCRTYAGNSASPWGVWCSTYALPALNTPVDLPLFTYPVRTNAITSKVLAATDIGTKNPNVPGDNYLCRWNYYTQPPSIYSGADGNHWAPNNAINRHDGSGCNDLADECGVTLTELSDYTSIDGAGCAAWVDGPNVGGMVYSVEKAGTVPGFDYGAPSGGLGYPVGAGRNHVFYGPSQGPGQQLCAHGQNGAAFSYGAGTGDGTFTKSHSLFVMDRNDFYLAATDAISPYANYFKPTQRRFFSDIPKANGSVPDGLGDFASSVWSRSGMAFIHQLQLLIICSAYDDPGVCCGIAVPRLHFYEVTANLV